MSLREAITGQGLSALSEGELMGLRENAIQKKLLADHHNHGIQLLDPTVGHLNPALICAVLGFQDPPS
jgi:hypothetical protein